MKQRVYISGPMTGMPENNFPAFHAAARELRALGLDVVSPAEINSECGGRWEDYLRKDIKALCDCDTLVLLPGWEASRGAHLELHLAHRLGMKISALGDFLPARDTDGPRGTYGCACPSKDAAECAAIKYGSREEPCECLCHEWSDDDEERQH